MGQAQARKMTVGWSAVSAPNAPYWVMRDAGSLPISDEVPIVQIADRTPQARRAELDHFYDNSLVQELIGDGFFNSLWRNQPNLETFSTRLVI